MAHTLQIYNGDEGTTLDIAATAATGYHLTAYNPSMSGYADQRNSSLYAPGEFSVMGKYANIVESITLEVVGTSRDDLLVKVRALFRVIECARDYIQAPAERAPSMLIYAPDSSTNTGYSVILGGRVDVPGIDSTVMQGAGGEGEFLSNVITGIVVTIEREPFWRTSQLTGNGSVETSIMGSTQSLPWGAWSISAPACDLPSGVRLEVNDNLGSNTDTVWFGYSSQKRKGTGYSGAGLIESEAGTMGTDTAVAADATASPGGGGNTKVRCTFAGTATDAERVTVSASPGFGTFRLLVRCQLSAAGTVTMYAKYQPANLARAQKYSNSPVTITHTAWRMVDIGIISLPNLPYLHFTRAVQSTFLTLSAARTAGAASLDIDFFFLMPVDEGLVKISGIGGSADRVLYSNELVFPVVYIYDTVGTRPVAYPQWSGDMLVQPQSAGYLYAIAGDANFANVFNAAGNYFTFNGSYARRYLAPRGNG